MQQKISLLLELVEQADWGYHFRLQITNESLNVAFVPTLEITDLKFAPIENPKPREWGTHLMVTGESGGTMIEPGRNQSFMFRVRPCTVDAEVTSFQNDWEYRRWCLHLIQGEFLVWYDLTVDETYFNPDSHLRYSNVKKMAEDAGAILWCGTVKSNIVNVYHAEIG